MSAAPFTVRDDGVRLSVRVTPRAKKSALIGLTMAADGQSVLSIRLSAAPVDGAANKALIAFIAAELKLPRSAVRIISGETSRTKILLLSGDATLVDRLNRWTLPETS